MESCERELKSLFEECADLPEDRLSFLGLQEICKRLNLQTYSNELADALLLSENDSHGVNFDEFKESLIQYFEPPQEAVVPEGGSSPSREVSPKYVFGKKKYGRRSRPDITDCENLVDSVEACSVTEEMEEISVKKRKTCDESENTEVGAAAVPAESNEEEMLITAWSSVAPPGGRILRHQLVQVFQGVGLHDGSEEAAASVFEKLEIGNEGITLESLLAFIKSGVPLSRESRTQDFSDSLPSLPQIEFNEPSTTSGTVARSSILELWESAGITDGSKILLSLGCRPGDSCDLAKLSSRLHSLLQQTREGSQDNLLRAALVLQRTYISSLRGAVDQMNCDNEKLKEDVSRANRRSQMLAQEVDDHHSKLEAATARRVKTLEQRHSERVRELTEQVKIEQEQLSQQNAILEKRVSSLEADEVFAREKLTRLEGENQQLHQEHQNLMGQISVLNTERDGLRKSVQELSLVQEKLHELEEMTKDRDVLLLMDRVAGLELENRNLRDRNDELVLQVEHLSIQLQSNHKRQSPEHSLNLTVDTAMRDINALEMDSDVTPSFSDFDLDESKTEQPSQGISGVCLLKFKFALAEKLPLDVVGTVSQELENVFKSDLKCDCCQLQCTIESLKSDLTKIQEEDLKLKTRCKELEQSMELLQEEYERTEDYWTGKLEDERTLFDAEQKQSDQKYSELVNKILEYEEMMKAEVAVRQRLETIDEKDGLERQVMEMEEEYSKLLAEKDEEIERLQSELNSHPSMADAPAQTDLPPPVATLPPPPPAPSAPPPYHSNSESSQHSHCRRSLTFSSGDRRRSCCKVYRLQGEVRTLLEAKQIAQREVSALLAERNLLYKQMLSQRREDNCSASLSSKLLCAERRCRTLMATLRNQQLQTAELLRSTWQQHKREVEELRGVLAGTDGKLQQQAAQMQQQLSKMAAADVLVKDLFVENAHLLAALRKMEAEQFYRQNHSSH